MGVRRIANASPLILLSKVDRLDLLRVAADEVIVPDRVIGEIRAHGTSDVTVQTIEKTDWLRVVPTPMISAVIESWNLGAGESAVLSIALAEEDVEVVLDDLAARRRAAAYGLKVRGTVGIVLLARQNGVIPAARPLIEELRGSGLYLTEESANQMLALVGE